MVSLRATRESIRGRGTAVPVRIRPARKSIDVSRSNGDAEPDNRLAFVDQALFAGQQATRQAAVIQCVWVYEHAIDFDGLKRFHHNLGRGLLGRRIERSPLPFARHRWVSDLGPDIEIAECPRPRTELSDWADERSQLATCSEWGPGWHLGVLPLTDGSTAVSLVVSHYIIDGLGLALALAEAVLGKTRELGYPMPRSRTRRRAVVQDARQTAQGTPEVARALVAAAKMARRQWRDISRPAASQAAAISEGFGDHAVVVPVITIHIDLEDWDARAKALGATSTTLAAGLAAKLGERIGRKRAGDGAVTLQIAMSDRTEGDTRANAMSFARVSVDPARLTTDLRGLRVAIKRALTTMRETPDESLQLLPLSPLTPKRALKRLADGVGADPDLPVTCSNLGDLGSVVCRLDGTDAEYASARVTGLRATRQRLERAGGQLTLLSWRVCGKIGITVVGYQPGGNNTKPALRELAAQTLAEFDLIGEID
jgi:hypothetical protein